jgi:hypothetical protein
MLALSQDEHVLRDNKKYTTLETRKEGVKFVNAHLRELGNKLTVCYVHRLISLF